MVSQPLLIDQHIGSATYIETMRDESFSIHLIEYTTCTMILFLITLAYAMHCFVIWDVLSKDMHHNY